MSKGIAAGFAISSLALTLTITESGAAQKGNRCSQLVRNLRTRRAEPWTERT